MGHPFSEHREHKVAKDRVSHIRGYATGGAVAGDAPAKAAGGAVAKKATAKQRMAGGAVKARLDRQPRATGGRAKHKGKTVVNVNVASGHPGAMPIPALAGGPPPGGPPMMPPRPPMAPPMAGPPGMPPGMPPGGAPMGLHSKGGKVKRAHGGSVKDGPAWNEGLKNGTKVSDGHGQSDLKDIGRGKAITYNKGGSVPQTPAGSGVAPKASRQPRATGGKAMAPGFTIKEAKGASGVDRLGVTRGEGGGPKTRGGAAEGLARLDKIKLYGGK